MMEIAVISVPESDHLQHVQAIGLTKSYNVECCMRQTNPELGPLWLKQ